jgi:phosphatidylethanolamine/phosphatidyl-N-methylethanolamine N-methyltransferase
MRDRAKFLAAFVRRPFDTGSITPSSPQLAAAMVEGMGLAEADTVVELGPGTGVFTERIVEQLKPAARLFCMEINCGMAEELTRRFPGIRVVNDTVENLSQHLAAEARQSVDAIVSGLPWAAFSPDRQRRLLDAALAPLRTGGRFATFAYSHAAWMPPARHFRELLDARFSEVDTSKVIWRNVPPAFVYRCRK